jgi:hypothetical protein
VLEVHVKLCFTVEEQLKKEKKKKKKTTSVKLIANGMGWDPLFLNSIWTFEEWSVMNLMNHIAANYFKETVHLAHLQAYLQPEHGVIMP